MQDNQLVHVKVTKILNKCPFFKNNATSSFYNMYLEWIMWCLIKLLLHGCSPTWTFHETADFVFNVVASRSGHFDTVMGSFCCSVSVYGNVLLSRCQESGSRVVFGNIKHSNPPPEKRKVLHDSVVVFMYQHIVQEVLWEKVMKEELIFILQKKSI
jgi:hypothetical protein